MIKPMTWILNFILACPVVSHGGRVIPGNNNFAMLVYSNTRIDDFADTMRYVPFQLWWIVCPHKRFKRPILPSGRYNETLVVYRLQPCSRARFCVPAFPCHLFRTVPQTCFPFFMSLDSPVSSKLITILDIKIPDFMRENLKVQVGKRLNAV